MRRRPESPSRTARVAKPIAPNPWRRGRRRTRVQVEGNEASGVTASAVAAVVVGLFPDREHVERAYRALSERGYERESVNLVITDKTRQLHFPVAASPDKIETHAAQGAAGGVVGALVGSGIPRERVAEYEDAVNNGGILLSVRTRSEADAEHFEHEWGAYGGENVRP